MARKSKAKTEAGREAALEAWSTMDKRKAEKAAAQLRDIWRQMVDSRPQAALAFAEILYEAYAHRLANGSNDEDWTAWGDCQALRAMADEIYRRLSEEIPSDLELAARYLK